MSKIIGNTTATPQKLKTINGQSLIGDGDLTVEGGSSYEIGHGLKLDEDNKLCVDTATKVEGDNTKPITAAAVYTEIGNINALLETI